MHCSIRHASLCLALAALFLPGSSRGDAFLVKDGVPQAEIVLAETPPRPTRLAARELQESLRKISGATLPVTHQPGGAPVQVYVWRSPHTDKLGI